MEIVKQYLEKRIELLKKGLANNLYSKITAQQYRTLLQELEQVLTLFNEEYEKHKTNLDNLHNNVDRLHKLLIPKQTL